MLSWAWMQWIVHCFLEKSCDENHPEVLAWVSPQCDEGCHGGSVPTLEACKTRGWKLFLFPRMLLQRPPSWHAVTDDVEQRAARALFLVQMGELSAGHQALEGAEVAPGNNRTLEQGIPDEEQRKMS